MSNHEDHSPGAVLYQRNTEWEKMSQNTKVNRQR